MAVVLANAYGGFLFSFLSVTTKLQQPINSMQELAESKDVQLIVLDRTDLAIQLLVIYWILNPLLDHHIGTDYNIRLCIQNASNGYEKVIGDSLRANPKNLVSNFKQVKEKLATGHYAFPFVSRTYWINIIKLSFNWM